MSKKNKEMSARKTEEMEDSLFSPLLSRSASTSRSHRSKSERFSKEVLQKYLKLIKPLYVKISGKNGEKVKLSGDLLSSASSTLSPSVAFVSLKREKQGNIPAGFRGACKHLGKSKSASMVTGIGSPARKSDDTLQLQYDGIQSAILHCKRSFNSRGSNYWRLAPGGEPIMHASDWRSELQPHVRKGVVQQIMNAVKLYNPLDDDDEDVMQELEKFSQNFEHKTFAMATSQSDYFQSIISKEVSIMRKMQEEAYQKIKMLKEMYLPELNVVYQKILNKIRQLDSLPQRAESESDTFQKLKMFKGMMERIIAFLHISDSNYVSPWMSKKLPLYEQRVYNFVNVNRPKESQIPKNTRVQVHHLSSSKA